MHWNSRPALPSIRLEVVSIETENGRVKGVVTQLNGEYSAKCVVIATGTNLGGKIFVGDAWYASGPDGMHAANALTDSLKAAGLPLRRFKTGTPARVHRRSIDFSKLECQPGDPDNELQPFSFMTDAPMHNKVECWIAYTNPETHRIILDNIQRSPLYGGMIEGVGPRYCPSIEDKVVRFAGKDRHPIFVEPCGENTEEMYLQGASSSLPEDVQNAFYRSIKGFETHRDHAPGLRHRVRLRRPHQSGSHAGKQGGAGPVRCGPVQRHLRLRGSRRPGPAGRTERRPQCAGQRAAHPAAPHQLSGHAGGRSGHQRVSWTPTA